MEKICAACNHWHEFGFASRGVYELPNGRNEMNNRTILTRRKIRTIRKNEKICPNCKRTGLVAWLNVSTKKFYVECKHCEYKGEEANTESRALNNIKHCSIKTCGTCAHVWEPRDE